MAVRFSLALVALHCIGIRLLAYVLVTAGSRQIYFRSTSQHIIPVLYACSQRYCFTADCGLFAGHASMLHLCEHTVRTEGYFLKAVLSIQTAGDCCWHPGSLFDSL